MALKVLLADDSAAIKKVVQLSLQDLGLELKNISSGKDALDVAKQFKPDIAFIDVLLPQKSGYEVTTEIKKDSALKKTPVVLLWSAFMAFDEAKYKSCGADAKLEKPFESHSLRALITKLVPQSAKMAEKGLPKVEFEVPIGSVPPAKNKSSKTQSKPPPQKDEWSMASFEDINAFSSKLDEDDDGEAEHTHTEIHIPPIPQATPNLPPIPPTSPKPAKAAAKIEEKKVPEVPKVPPPPPAPQPASAAAKPAPAPTPAPVWTNDSEWVKKDLGKFKVSVPKTDDPPDSVSFEYSDSQIVDTSFLFKPQDTGTSTILKKQNELENSQSTNTGTTTNTSKDLSLEELSDIKLETRGIIEKVVWKLVPELASQIIKEELDRLLSEEK